jgi:hypothetical protein
VHHDLCQESFVTVPDHASAGVHAFQKHCIAKRTVAITTQQYPHHNTIVIALIVHCRPNHAYDETLLPIIERGAIIIHCDKHRCHDYALLP